jgi:hypothetical protein
MASGLNPARVVAVNPTTGAQRIVASGGSLSLVTGLSVFNANGGSAGSSISPSASASSATSVNAPSSAVPDNANAAPEQTDASLAITTALPQTQPVSVSSALVTTQVSPAPASTQTMSANAAVSAEPSQEAADPTVNASKNAIDLFFVDWQGNRANETL